MSADIQVAVEPVTEDPRKYSTDDERFEYDTAADAMDAMHGECALAVGSVYYSCTFEPVVLSDYLNAERILENADEALYDDIGECAEDAFSVRGDALNELQHALDAWCSKHLAGSHYWRSTGKSTEHTVTAEDIATREGSCQP